MSKWIRTLERTYVDPRGEDLIEGPKKEKTTVKAVLCSILYSFKPEKAKDAIRITTKILPMIVNSKKAVELEDADYDIVKKAVEENPIQYNAGIWGQTLAAIEEADDIKEKSGQTLENKGKGKR